MKGYVAPDPTPEQIANAARQGSDAWDRLGSVTKKCPLWDFAPDDTLAAAGLIHDEQYMYELSPYVRAIVDQDFARDVMILADSCDDVLKRIFERGKAYGCAQIVFAITATGEFPTDRDRNTDVTRAQGIEQMNDAKRWINTCARKIGEPVPYLEAGYDTPATEDVVKVNDGIDDN